MVLEPKTFRHTFSKIKRVFFGKIDNSTNSILVQESKHAQLWHYPNKEKTQTLPMWTHPIFESPNQKKKRIFYFILYSCPLKKCLNSLSGQYFSLSASLVVILICFDIKVTYVMYTSGLFGFILMSLGFFKQHLLGRIPEG